MAEVLPAGDKIKDYDSRVDPDAPPQVAQEMAEKRQKSHSILGYFSLVQLHVITLIFTLSASGLVTLTDIAFVVLTTLYLTAMNATIFKPTTKGPSPDVMSNNSWTPKWSLFTAGIGLVLPSGYLLGGFVHGDQKALKAVAPHLFLLGCQILSENVAFRSARVALPIRAMVPVFYNVRRLFTLMEWVKVDMNKGSESLGMHGADTGPFTPHQWIMFGRYLAITNMLVWSFNLFFFLIPVVLPRTMRTYYQSEMTAAESRAKDARDNKDVSTDF